MKRIGDRDKAERKGCFLRMKSVKKAVSAAAFILCFLIMGAIGLAEDTESVSPDEKGLSFLQEGEDIYNLLLIGSDRRDESWNGNSDVMILVTINPEKEKIVMTSFMRDLYAEIPEYGVHKLNYAFAVGGADKLEETLEDNYQLSIDNYMIVDFESMARIIDMIGGVELTITDEECEVMNGYLVSMDAEESFLPGGGTYVMNGDQIVAYTRNRYVGNNDYQRTQRQRNVLSAIFEGIQGMSKEKLLELSVEILSEVEHNLGIMKITQLMAELPELAGYELEENRIPYDDLYHSQDEMLVPDFEETIQRLHETIGE